MSRLGKLPIELPGGTQATISDGVITVKGPKGELKQEMNDKVKVTIEKDQILVGIDDKNNKKEKALWGLMRSLIKNMVDGVVKGFEKKLEINGVGYKVAASGNKLVINVGYSNPVELLLPAGISAGVEGNVITISGIDKYLVGETAARIRRIRKPEPYLGKGIKYVDEVIRRKEGKAVSKGE